MDGTHPNVAALVRLRPGAEWNWINPDDYKTLTWLDGGIAKPTAQEIEIEKKKPRPLE